MICSPSFLSSDMNKLESEIKSISQAQWLHFDVMDGLFVPNTTYDQSMLERLKPISNQFFDCHLMIDEPEKHFQKYIDAGADLVTFHYEATIDSLSLINQIKTLGVKVGISVKPDTDITLINPLLNELDLVLVMSVEPGAGGQKFLTNAIDKIGYLNEKRKTNGYDYLIEVDGGINFETAELVKQAGCDVIVVGSFIFNQDDREKVIRELEDV